jgi:hypothetical protein
VEVEVQLLVELEVLGELVVEVLVLLVPQQQEQLILVEVVEVPKEITLVLVVLVEKGLLY